MTTPSGTIGLSDVNAELGLSPSALITMNDSNVRTLAGVGGSGTIISMNDLRNKSNRVSLSLTISASTYNYNAYSAVSSSPGYNAGKTDATITINPGVTVGSTSTGSAAFSIPSSFNPGDTVTIVNNGTILGAGGNGGTGGYAGGSSASPGSPGGSGGTAVLVQRPTTITNNGTLSGGGGGGGGGGGARAIYYGTDREGPTSNTGYTSGSGGGGGAGYNAGSGGSAGPHQYGTPYTNYNGNPGSPTAGGSTSQKFPSPYPYTNAAIGGQGGVGGGRGSSGAGGQPGYGSYAGGALGFAQEYWGSGGSGGGAGAYINGSPYVTWPATGTRTGPAS